jgi:hypothetical protein
VAVIIADQVAIGVMGLLRNAGAGMPNKALDNRLWYIGLAQLRDDCVPQAVEDQPRLLYAPLGQEAIIAPAAEIAPVFANPCIGGAASGGLPCFARRPCLTRAKRARY